MSPPNPITKDGTPTPPPEPSTTAPEPPSTPETPNSSAPASAPTEAPAWWRRLHLVIGGGYNFGTRVHIDAPAYEAVAPSYSGGMVFFQPSFSVVNHPNFNFRVGADVRVSPLSVSQRTGAPDSNITATSIAPMIEGTYLPHRHFGIGLNLAVGYMGLSSSNADVGAPYSATFDFGSEGGAYVGAQLFVTSWNQAFRLGVSLDTMPGGFGLATGTPSPAVSTVMSPMWTIFVGVDPIQIISNATEPTARSQPPPQTH